MQRLVVGRAAALVWVAACSAPPPAGAGSSASGPAPAASSRWADDFSQGVTAAASAAWVDFAAYPGARGLCEHTSNGLPHVFTRIYATNDPLEQVAAFYRGDGGAGAAVVRPGARGPVVTSAAGELPRIELVPVASGLPRKCEARAGELVALVIVEQPPFPH
ncbi:MAG: hypothetical protein HY908_24565 [Myxococcales bacterium]|nr:hypothetical protein [Myxococcales bacterium]